MFQPIAVTSIARSPARPVATLLAAFAALLLAPQTGLAAAKGPSPKLVIEAKQCRTGATPAERSFAITALGLPAKGSGDRVALRFRAQQRGPGATKWEPVVAVAGLGGWEIGQPATGLRFTKTLTPLGEETRYRVFVEARTVNAAGKAVSKLKRRTVTCNQPRFTADVRIRKVAYEPAAEPRLSVRVANAGKAPAAPSIVSLLGADGGVLQQVKVPALRGGQSRVVRIPVSACDGSQRVVVEDQRGADGTPASGQHEATVTCDTGKQAKRSRR